MSLKDTFLSIFLYQAETAGKTHTLYSVAEELGLLDANDESYYASENLYGQMSITLSFYGTFSATASENLATVAKTLLPKLGELRKEFDETQNRISLVAEYKGVKIVLSSETPKTCTVEKVEETVEVPEQIVPAHVEKKVRWVMKGDCDPLIVPTEPSLTGA
jgi:hypothetical protein